MRRFSLILVCLLAASQPIFAQQHHNKIKETQSSLIERVESTGFVQLEAESFKTLTPKQQALAYWLSQASIAVHPIIFDQRSRFGLRQKRILEAIVSHPEGINPEVAKKITDFTKLFWANRGNHNDTTAQKLLPKFTFEEFTEAAMQTLRNGGLVDTPEQLHKELNELRPSLFDPNFEPMLTAKNPRGNLDILQASANNFYSNVTLNDLKGFAEKYPLNSRVIKMDNGQLVEQIYRAGTDDGRVQAGLYAPYLEKAIFFLKKARGYADAEQVVVIDDLIHYYKTGESKDWLKFGASWVQNNAKVDFANGFIEVYLDARGAKGTSQSFVSITDERVNSLMTKIAQKAQYFEDNAPWDPQYKKQGVKPPLAKAIETVIETGDFLVSTIGDNLPNEDEIHQTYGTKSFLFTGSTRAFSNATGTTTVEEFAASPEEIEISKKYGGESEDLLVAMHEIIGHGSGKLSPKLTHEAAFYLKEYASTLEEARADLVALWYIFDPKLVELGLVSSPDVGKAMYYNAARVLLTQLRSNPTGDSLEEDHQRNRQLIANYIMDKTGAIERVERNGKSYIIVKDFAKMREGVGSLLGELMRIKAEGDYPAIKALVDKYGVHFDPKLRDQVITRFEKLNLPTYFSGVNAELTAKFDANGEVVKVEMSYPRSIVTQQLKYSSMYEPLLSVPEATEKKK